MNSTVIMHMNMTTIDPKSGWRSTTAPKIPKTSACGTKPILKSFTAVPFSATDFAR